MPSETPNARLRGPSPTAVVLIAALVIRAGVLWGVPGGFSRDIDGYAAVADNLLRHGVFGYGERATAFRPPLYPVLLAAVRASGLSWTWGAGILHLALGLATVSLAMALARRWGFGAWAWIAGILTACDPLLLFHSRLLMTETLSAALSAIAVWLATVAARKDAATAWFFAGILLGWNALTRPTFLAWIPLAVILVLLCGNRAKRCPTPTEGPTSLERRSVKSLLTGLAWRPAVFTALGSAAAILPWGVRNYVVFGSPVFGTTHGGYTFYLANNPDYYAYLNNPARRGVWDAAAFNRRWEQQLYVHGVRDEPAADRLAYDLARRTIASQPGTFLWACWERLSAFWGLLPNAAEGEESLPRRLGRYAVAGFYALELSAAAVGAWVLLRKPSVISFPGSGGTLTRGEGDDLGRTLALRWALSAAAVLTIVHAFYWTNLRMRTPLMPLVAVFAAAGIAAGYRVLRCGRSAATKCVG